MRRHQGFVIEGVVDGRAATARWADGVLVGDVEVRRRAEVIVALGEHFKLEDGPGERILASLDDGITAALLTVLRAFSAVSAIDVDLRPTWDRDARSDA